MPEYIVRTPEVWMQYYQVTADNANQAKDKVPVGDARPLDRLFEFSHVLDNETWEVEECFDETDHSVISSENK